MIPLEADTPQLNSTIRATPKGAVKKLISALDELSTSHLLWEQNDLSLSEDSKAQGSIALRCCIGKRTGLARSTRSHRLGR